MGSLMGAATTIGSDEKASRRSIYEAENELDVKAAKPTHYFYQAFGDFIPLSSDKLRALFSLHSFDFPHADHKKGGKLIEL